MNDLLILLFFICLAVLLSIWLVFWPWRRAKKRRHRNAQAIFMLCLFLGWTTLGWIAAWIWAYTDNVEPEPDYYSLTGRRV